MTVSFKCFAPQILISFKTCMYFAVPLSNRSLLMLKLCDFNENVGKFSRTPDISFADLSCLGLLTFGNIAGTDEF